MGCYIYNTIVKQLHKLKLMALKQKIKRKKLNLS